MDFDVKIIGGAGLEVTLNKISTGLREPRELYQSLAEFMAARTAERFRAGGLPKRWREIKKKSRQQRKGDKGTPPLWDVGNLFKEATATKPGVANSLFALTPDGFVEGSDRADAARHQLGFKGRDKAGRKVNEPARPFEDITSDDERGMGSITDQYIATLVGSL